VKTSASKAVTKPKPKKKRKKDPNAPKKPTTAYAFYLKDRKNEFQAQNPGMKYPEITKLISAAWKALDNDAKKPYTEKYGDDRKRYQKQLENYEKKKSSESEESSEDSPKKKKKRRRRKSSRRKILSLLNKLLMLTCISKENRENRSKRIIPR